MGARYCHNGAFGRTLESARRNASLCYVRQSSTLVQDTRSYCAVLLIVQVECYSIFIAVALVDVINDLSSDPMALHRKPDMISGARIGGMSDALRRPSLTQKESGVLGILQRPTDDVCRGDGPLCRIY